MLQKIIQKLSKTITTLTIPLILTLPLTTTNPKAQTPTTHELKQNYPNPFNPNTTAPFTINTNTNTTLSIYNILGQQITNWQGTLNPGEYTANINASGLPSGLYILNLKTKQHTESIKIILEGTTNGTPQITINQTNTTNQKQTPNNKKTTKTYQNNRIIPDNYNKNTREIDQNIQKYPGSGQIEHIPYITQADITPLNPTTNDTIYITATLNDPDPEQNLLLAYDIYNHNTFWYRIIEPTNHNTPTTTTIPPDSTTTGDEIKALIKGWDGQNISWNTITTPEVNVQPNNEYTITLNAEAFNLTNPTNPLNPLNQLTVKILNKADSSIIGEGTTNDTGYTTITIPAEPDTILLWTNHPNYITTKYAPHYINQNTNFWETYPATNNTSITSPTGNPEEVTLTAFDLKYAIANEWIPNGFNWGTLDEYGNFTPGCAVSVIADSTNTPTYAVTAQDSINIEDLFGYMNPENHELKPNSLEAALGYDALWWSGNTYPFTGNPGSTGINIYIDNYTSAYNMIWDDTLALMTRADLIVSYSFPPDDIQGDYLQDCYERSTVQSWIRSPSMLAFNPTTTLDQIPLEQVIFRFLQKEFTENRLEKEYLGYKVSDLYYMTDPE